MTYTPIAQPAPIEEPLQSPYPVDGDWYWVDEEQSTIKHEQEDGSIICISANSPEYDLLIELGAVVNAYVAPPEPEPLTTEEKLNRLLSDYGLTRDEMKSALATK